MALASTVGFLAVLATLCLAQEGPVPQNPPDPSSVTPIPTPTPTAKPPPAPVAPSCKFPGKSASCSGKPSSSMAVVNKGRITLRLVKVGTNGSLGQSFRILIGQKRKLPGSCAGQRWLVKTRCGSCTDVFEVGNSGTFVLDYAFAEPDCANFPGKWDPPVKWGVIPVGVANVPHPSGGKLLGFAAQGKTHFKNAQNKHLTEAQLFDPEEKTFQDIDLVGHDIFCAALTLLPDGRMFAGGGGTGTNSYKVSTFDPFKLKWNRHKDMQVGHWYGTAIVTKQNRVMVSLGIDKTMGGKWLPHQNFPEISGPNFNFDANWKNMSGINYKNKHWEEKHWYPQQHMMSNGKILHYGTQNGMYTINTGGKGSIKYVGDRNTKRKEEGAWGATSIFYDKGQVMAMAGIEGWVGGKKPTKGVFKRAILIDFRKPNKVKTSFASDLLYQRAFPSAVVLPDGNVLVIGGKNNEQQWNDTASVMIPELWNPKTGKWTQLATHEKPRNYHSVAILTQSGRVFSGGGGLCGNCGKLNQPNSELFSPPYLFNDAGKVNPRPVISSAPTTIKPQQAFKIVVKGPGASNVGRISLVKQCVTTHSISTDQRQVTLKKVGGKKALGSGKFEYTVVAKMNRNVLVPGYWFLFVFNGGGTPSVAANIRSL